MGMGFSRPWPQRTGVDTVSTILEAIQSKKAMPSRSLISGVILKVHMLTMPLSLPRASRPLNSTSATRNVDPPTSRDRYWPLSAPLGS